MADTRSGHATPRDWKGNDAMEDSSAPDWPPAPVRPALDPYYGTNFLRLLMVCVSVVMVGEVTSALFGPPHGLTHSAFDVSFFLIVFIIVWLPAGLGFLWLWRRLLIRHDRFASGRVARAAISLVAMGVWLMVFFLAARLLSSAPPGPVLDQTDVMGLVFGAFVAIPVPIIFGLLARPPAGVGGAVGAVGRDMAGVEVPNT